MLHQKKYQHILKLIKNLDSTSKRRGVGRKIATLTEWCDCTVKKTDFKCCQREAHWLTVMNGTWSTIVHEVARNQQYIFIWCQNKQIITCTNGSWKCWWQYYWWSSRIEVIFYNMCQRALILMAIGHTHKDCEWLFNVKIKFRINKKILDIVRYLGLRDKALYTKMLTAPKMTIQQLLLSNKTNNNN